MSLFHQCYFSQSKTCFSGPMWDRRDPFCYFTWAEFLCAAIDHLLYKKAGMEQRFEHRFKGRGGGPLSNFILMKSFSQRSLNLVEKLVHSVKLYA